MIIFDPTAETRGPVAAGPVQNGKYSLTSANGPVAGRHRVRIQGLRKVMLPSQPAGDVDTREQYLPAKYNSSTTLEATIDATTKTLDFNLAK